MSKSKEDDFESVFQDLLSEVNEEDVALGVTNKLQETDPELFIPRGVSDYKAELIRLDEEADVDHLTEFDVLMDDINGCHAKRMNEILGNMNNNNFVQNYQRLLNYVKPKLKAIDIETHEPKELTQINVTVINSKEEMDETD